MSANGETSNVMKGISQGACDYLLKPVRLEELRNIWQHVVRKQHVSVKESEYTPDPKDEALMRIAQTDPKTAIQLTEEGNGSCNSQRRRKGYLDDDSANEEDDNLATAKRLRVVWSVELHQKFVGAINHLGLEQAVPKRILDFMNVPGLTRENVASHLQKYRLYLKKMRGSINQKLGMPMCISSSDTSFVNSHTFLNGLSSSQQSPAHFSRQVVMPLQPTAYVKNCEIYNKQGVATPPINNKGMGTNQYFDPRLPSLPSLRGLAMESNTGTAFASDGQLRFVSQIGYDAPHQQNLRLPKSTGTLWIEKPNSFEPEFLTGDHLFIHQLETAVDKLPGPRDLRSVLDLIER